MAICWSGIKAAKGFSSCEEALSTGFSSFLEGTWDSSWEKQCKHGGILTKLHLLSIKLLDLSLASTPVDETPHFQSQYAWKNP